MNKYKAQKVGGYDSKKEYRRAQELKLLEKAGEISELQEQVKYLLIPAQYQDIDGKKKCVEQACSYIADFTYRDKAGKLVVEDTKGVRTPEYIIKRKLMLFTRDIKIKEV